MLDIGSQRLVRTLRGWLLLLAALAALLVHAREHPEIEASLGQTAEVIGREWRTLPDIQIVVPDSLGISPGTLFSAYMEDGTEDIVGEVWRCERREDERFDVRIRLLPEASAYLCQASTVEVVFPPRDNLEAASLVFDTEFQARLVSRLKWRAQDLLEQRLRPRAYELLAQAFAQVRPADARIETFIAEDLFPRLKQTFSEDVEGLQAKILADLNATLTAWDKAGIGWTLLFGDPATLSGTLGPIVEQSVEGYWTENKGRLLEKLFGVWPAYEEHARKYFEDVVSPVLYEGVLVPLWEENKTRLLDLAVAELQWAYGETLLAPNDSFDRLFIYVARHLVLRRREAKLFIRPESGEPCTPGQEMPVRLYFRPGSPLYTIE